MSCSHYEERVEKVELPQLKVNGVAIGEDLLARELQYHPADSYALALEAACRALIVRQLLLQRADALGIEARCEDGETPEEARIRQLLEEEVQVPEADEDACRTWYAANPGRLLGPWRLQLRHVLLACAPDDLEGRETARKQAAELLDELRGHPERFVDLARRFSACPSKESGGDLGWIEPGRPSPNSRSACCAARPGCSSIRWKAAMACMWWNCWRAKAASRSTSTRPAHRSPRTCKRRCCSGPWGSTSACWRETPVSRASPSRARMGAGAIAFGADVSLSLPHINRSTQDMTDWIDGQGRQIDYLRLSVTDRCDFRCVYCMAEDMRFLPRQQVLTLEEIERVARLFVAGGVRKLRLTGGEPLVRPGIVGLCERLAALPGLRELCMTSNGSQLVRYARPLYDAGLSRLNISLDTLDPLRFRAITRNGELDKVLAGIDAAQAAGFRRIKLNAVVMKGRNADEVPALVDFAIARGLDISFIEEMPLGQVGRERGESFCSSDEVRALIAQRHALLDSAEQSGGPARYVRLVEHPQTRIGFISPHSHNFCATCNRLRLTVEGRLLLCLGHEHSLDLRALLRRHPLHDGPLLEAIGEALQRKPARHEFSAAGEVQVLRFMNMSGG